MDARIKSGHDGCVSSGEVKERRGQGALRAHANFKIFKQQNNSRYDFAISRRDAPELCIYLPPNKRAWGMPDARCTRGLVCTWYW